MLQIAGVGVIHNGGSVIDAFVVLIDRTDNIYIYIQRTEEIYPICYIHFVLHSDNSSNMCIYIE